MPWKATCPVEEKFRFIIEWKKHEMPMAALCRAFGVSRQTGYKWVGRYYEDGPDGCPAALEDRPRRPLSHPQQVGSAVVELVVWARKKWPHWGPRKLRVWLSDRVRPDLILPAPSTIGEILRREGLIRPRRRRRHTPPSTQPFGACTAPNQVWCVDFKGWFRTGDGIRCYPLTISDAFSRYLIRCEGVLDPDGREVREIFESAFRDFGLPVAIRSDNGPPFACTGVAGLTELAVWWIRLGIRHERIDPGKPQQNGRHERMHLTLKQETASPPERNLRTQQRAFDRFRRVYNEVRPHEALAMKSPASVYAPSTRRFPGHLPRSAEMDFDSEQGFVDPQGFVAWRRGKIFIGRALRHQLIDFTAVGDRLWQLSFGPVVLGLFNEKAWSSGLIRPKRRRRRKVSAMSPV